MDIVLSTLNNTVPRLFVFPGASSALAGAKREAFPSNRGLTKSSVDELHGSRQGADWSKCQGDSAFGL